MTGVQTCALPISDTNSLGIEWIPLDKLKEIRIFPKIFKEYIHLDGSLENKIYLGLVD